MVIVANRYLVIFFKVYFSCIYKNNKLHDIIFNVIIKLLMYYKLRNNKLHAIVNVLCIKIINYMLLNDLKILLRKKNVLKINYFLWLLRLIIELLF